MTTQLLQIMPFVLQPGQSIGTTHNININGIKQAPDFVASDNPGVAVSADATFVTATNRTPVNQNVNVWLELKHSIPRELGKGFGDPFASMNPRPFAAASGNNNGPWMLARVNADGSLFAGFNVQGVAHVAASGVYDITLNTAVIGTGIPVATPGSGAQTPIPSISAEFISANVVRVTTQDPNTNAGLDYDFNLTVHVIAP